MYQHVHLIPSIPKWGEAFPCSFSPLPLMGDQVLPQGKVSTTHFPAMPVVHISIHSWPTETWGT